MFEKTIEKIVLKQLPGIELRLQVALTKSVEETFAKLSAKFSDEIFARISRVENEIKSFDTRLTAEQEGYTAFHKEFEETVKRLDEADSNGVDKDEFDSLKSDVEALPSPDDILTSDNSDFLTKDDFDPSDYDLVTNDDLPDKDDIVSEVTSTIVEKLKEALDGLTV